MWHIWYVKYISQVIKNGKGVFLIVLLLLISLGVVFESKKSTEQDKRRYQKSKLKYLQASINSLCFIQSFTEKGTF